MDKDHANTTRITKGNPIRECGPIGQILGKDKSHRKEETHPLRDTGGDVL